ncbi:MAG: MFS transporter [Candidatus Heimdallarchaeota archaeon]
MKRISGKQKSYMGITKAGGDILGVLFNGALLTFYINELNMDAKLFGIVMIIFVVWNAINDPMFGYISDKRKMDSKGKRTFFIRLSIPIYLIGYLLFWVAFPNWSQASLFIFLLIALFIFDTGLTIYGLNLSAIQTSQTTDSNERTRIMVVASVISFLPLGLAAILPNIVFTSNLSLIHIRLIFLVMAIIAAIFMFVGSFKMKEHSLEEEGVEPLPVWSAVKETFKSKSFILFVIVNFMLVGVATNIVGVMPLYFKYVSQIDELTVLFVSIPKVYYKYLSIFCMVIYKGK